MIESAFARVDDIDICYEIHGSGPRLVLISGTGADLRDNPVRDQHPLTRHFEVLMFDQRGLGRTTKPDEPYTMAGYASDAAGLMDAVGWDRAHVVGISFGGMVAQHLALDHPDRVERLVLMCTSSGGPGGASFDLLAIEDLPPDERAAIILPIFDSRNDLTTDPPTWAPFFDVIGPEILADSPDLNADEPNAAIGARRQLEARAHHNTWNRLTGLAASTLVAGGRYDLQASPVNVSNLAERIPNAELAFFDGGHLFMLQDRTAWPTVSDFLLTSRAPATSD